MPGTVKRQSSLDHRWSSAVLLVTIVMAALAIAGHISVAQRAAIARVTLAVAQERERAELAALSEVSQLSGGDAMRNITADAPTQEELLKDIHRSGGQLGASLASMSSTVTPASEGPLRRLQLELTLNGSYHSVKGALVELLGRDYPAVLQHAVFRRLSSPAELQLGVRMQIAGPQQARAEGSEGP
jgi:hypothetical protein